MPATPKKLLKSPQTPVRVSRRLRHEEPELNVSNPLTSPTKSARKRVLKFDEKADDKTPAKTPAKASPAEITITPQKSPTKSPEKMSPVKSPAKDTPQKSSAKVTPQKSPAKASPVKVSPAKSPEKMSQAKASPVKVSSAKIAITPQKSPPKSSEKLSQTKSPKKTSPAKTSPVKMTITPQKSPKLNTSKTSSTKSKRGKSKQEKSASSSKKNPKMNTSATIIESTPKTTENKSNQNISTADKDNFFLRSEMESFLDSQEKSENKIDLFAEFADDVGDADYRYEDFFGTPEDTQDKFPAKGDANKSDDESSGYEGMDPEEIRELNALKPLDAEDFDDESDENDSIFEKLENQIESDSDEQDKEMKFSNESDDNDLDDESEGYEDESHLDKLRNRFDLDGIEDEETSDSFEDEEENPYLSGMAMEDEEDEKGDAEDYEEELESDLEEENEEPSLKRVRFNLKEQEDSGKVSNTGIEFDLEDETPEHQEDEMLEQEDQEEEEPLTKFGKMQKSIKNEISKLEQQNLQPRSWELAGEVTAHGREKDTLLNQYIEVDYRAVQAPVIDENVNSYIESIVKKRIKDKNFDDVVRTKRVDESLQTYRARTTIDDIERKSLMEMYDEEYRKKAEKTKEKSVNVENEEQKLDPESELIEREMNAVFSKLDALCHSHYRPAEANGEVEVIVNKLAVNLEEVGQKASTAPDEELLAPEEIVKHSNYIPKSKEERSKTDRLRQRRKKKIIIRRIVKVKKIGKKNEKAENGKEENKGKFKSGKMFDQLQSTVNREYANVTAKAKKRKVDAAF